MEWFKHSTNDHKSKIIKNLINEVGHVGPVVYYALIEMCVDSLKRPKDKKLTENDMIFEIDGNMLASCAYTKRKIVIRCLDVIHNMSLIDYKEEDMLLIIKFSKLLKLLSSDQNRTSQQPDSNQSNPVLDIDKDKEKRIRIRAKAKDKEDNYNLYEKEDIEEVSKTLAQDFGLEFSEKYTILVLNKWGTSRQFDIFRNAKLEYFEMNVFDKSRLEGLSESQAESNLLFYKISYLKKAILGNLEGKSNA